MISDAKKRRAALDLYTNLMEEAKIRLLTVSAATDRIVLPAPILREFCFLQFRMVCELIALACLTAHGEIGTATK
jgi:hypothetical protein